ncbi:MAG: right-handed parallel beta-helix repeat-containing protein [Candidatus Binatia bacterium]
MRKQGRGSKWAAAFMIMAATTAHAGTFRVSSNGTDSGTCGAGTEPPCATIAQAVANASDGDSIAVGPGSYAGAVVSKSLSLSSSAGTGGAVLTGGVVLAANGIAFGKAGKGFTLAGGNPALSIAGDDVTVRGNLFTECTVGVEVTAGSDAVVRDNSFDDCGTGISVLSATAAQIRGNRFGYIPNTAISLGAGSSSAVVRENRTFGPAGVGIAVDGSNHLLWRNLAHGTPGGGIASTGAPVNVELRENLVVGSSAPAFNLATGSGWVLNRNAAVDSAGPGFYLAAGTTVAMTGNVAIGGNNVGILIMGGTDHVLEGNSSLQNALEGLVLASVGAGVQVSGGNLYGNGGSNCGLLNSSSSAVTTTGVYWGSAAGPGADPSDDVCGNIAAVVVNGPAGSPAKIKMPGIK